MFERIQNWRRRRSIRGSVWTGDLPSPEVPLELVGDIHGRADLLQKLPERSESAVRVYLGDYVDRGPDSKAVLEQLYSESLSNESICLAGNHEDFLLNFLVDPASAARWLRYGGLQTLASFGIGGVSETSTQNTLQHAADQLQKSLSFDLRSWLESLPLYWESGNVIAVHAGADPVLPIDAQDRTALVWGHPDFETQPRADGQWIAHGHTIVEKPVSVDGRISLDTGAYATGLLTMARIDPTGALDFIPFRV